MPDREKVLKGLECCITDGRASCEKCYQEGPGFGIACRQGLMRDALELLKAQEPRVLTPDEIIGWDGYIYGEYRQGVMDVALIVKGIENNRHKGTWATKQLNWEEYGKSWRYWSAMPTNEQRKAVKWDA